VGGGVVWGVVFCVGGFGVGVGGGFWGGLGGGGRLGGVVWFCGWVGLGFGGFGGVFFGGGFWGVVWGCVFLLGFGGGCPSSEGYDIPALSVIRRRSRPTLSPPPPPPTADGKTTSRAAPPFSNPSKRLLGSPFLPLPATFSWQDFPPFP